MSDTKVFDLSGSLERVDNDKELLLELVEIFFSEYDDAIERVASAIQSKNAKDLEESAHSIKSALGNIGAMTSFELAYELEKAGREHQFDTTDNLFDNLKTEIAKYKSEVAQLQN